MKRIPEIVEEGDKLPGGARRPPGEAGEVRAQRQQGIVAAAGGREDGGNFLSCLLRFRQILFLKSHPDTALAADVAAVEGSGRPGGESWETIHYCRTHNPASHREIDPENTATLGTPTGGSRRRRSPAAGRGGTQGRGNNKKHNSLGP
ncbi:PTS sugar transporter subunit IIA, putative [Babesia ovata]|uniref:PTS sugar transporter subunit IIA, putative n=1 Tax=Babesia ovata TaxID=189622 RepID=A0A2H6KKH1_9APIC|nr:PTS sugar transporter subunit IIA, putative [Babesia ovata]GBE63495.1 PTS sugar transporter subunit IIA, putative [Babesia ovata]